MKLDSKGPVYYQQERWGVNNQPIICYKFRTMHTKNGYNGNGGEDFEQTSRNDPRVTGLGKVLRKYSIDELPQFFNVLFGQMSVVGPRPDVEGYYDVLQGENRKILQLKPGITSESAIKYKNEEAILEKQENQPRNEKNVIS